MVLGKFLFIGALAACAVSALGEGLVGTLQLDIDGYDSNNGPFQWIVASSTVAGISVGEVISTYCLSETNEFSSGENPQFYTVYSLDGATATDSLVTSLVANNSQPNLSGDSLLAAAALAQTYGPANIANTTDNDNIHATESLTDPAIVGSYNRFLYFEQDNPGEYSYAGQPQGFIQPVPEPFTMALAIGGLGIAAKRRKSLRSA